MRELGIANSPSVSSNEEGRAYMAGISAVTEEMIYKEILIYINENRENELNEILEYLRCTLSYAEPEILR